MFDTQNQVSIMEIFRADQQTYGRSMEGSKWHNGVFSFGKKKKSFIILVIQVHCLTYKSRVTYY